MANVNFGGANGNFSAFDFWTMDTFGDGILITLYLSLDEYNKLCAATLVVMGPCHLPGLLVYMYNEKLKIKISW